MPWLNVVVAASGSVNVESAEAVVRVTVAMAKPEMVSHHSWVDVSSSVADEGLTPKLEVGVPEGKVITTDEEGGGMDDPDPEPEADPEGTTDPDPEGGRDEAEPEGSGNPDVKLPDGNPDGSGKSDVPEGTPDGSGNSDDTPADPEGKTDGKPEGSADPKMLEKMLETGRSGDPEETGGSVT